MSIFSGPQGKGAMSRHKAQKRAEAEARGARTDRRACGHRHHEGVACRAPEGGAR